MTGTCVFSVEFYAFAVVSLRFLLKLSELLCAHSYLNVLDMF